MSKLWDDLKENMKEWSSSAVEKAEEMSKIAMAKTEEMTRISKIKFEIHQLQREKDKKYQELGTLAYHHTKEDHMATFSGNTEFFEIVNRVDEIKTEITEKNNEIEKIQEEYGIDPDEVEVTSSTETIEPDAIIEVEGSVVQDEESSVSDSNSEKLTEE